MAFQEKTFEEVNAMNEEELLKYEDDLAAHEAGVEPDSSSDPDPEPSDKGGDPEPDPAVAAPPEGDPAGEGDEGTPPAKAGDEDGGDPAPAEPPTPKPAPEPAAAEAGDDVQEHITPPSKWAQQRREKAELKREAEELRSKAEKADQLENELQELRGKFEWIETAMKTKGVEIPKDPLDMVSEDKIADIREEHGDDMADLIVAFKAQFDRLSPKAPTPPAADPPAAEPTQPPAAPAAETPPAEPAGVNPAVLEAIDNNDSLSWWREKSPVLWKRAVEMDESLSKDPEYLALSFDDRYAKVVEEVKKAVQKPASIPKPDRDSPPANLSGSGGVVPAPTENEALRKLEAMSDPDAQMKYYESLPESLRDEVDKALNI